MAVVLRELYHSYFWVFRDMADHRTDNYLMLSSPLVPLAITISYLYFVRDLGPKLMENRKPFDIANIMRVYNVVQIVTNSYVAVMGFKIVLNADWSCSPVDYTDSPRGTLSLHVGYLYYLLKYLDLMDTIFFVLRKSYRQISFLHLYHHAVMVGCIWIGCRFVPGGTSLWLPAINSTVHVILYIYYLMATFDDKWKDVKYKKLLTQIQLVQFTILLYIFGRVLYQSDCDYPKWTGYLLVPQQLFMLMLFGDFYVKTYLKKINK